MNRLLSRVGHSISPRGTGHDLYQWTGSGAEKLTSTGFNGLSYFTTLSNQLFFAGEGGTGHNGVDLYCWTGSAFQQLSNMSFNYIGYLTTVNNQLFFSGYDGTGQHGNNLYRWTGSGIQQLSNLSFNDFHLSLGFLASLNNQLFLVGGFEEWGDGVYRTYDVYRWNGASFVRFTMCNWIDSWGNGTVYGSELFLGGWITNSSSGPMMTWGLSYWDILKGRM
jgi:hypothetical protein